MAFRGWGFWGIAGLLALAGLAYPAGARAETELPPWNEAMFYCPFIQAQDPFQFDGLMASVKALLETRISANDKCRAPMNQLLGSLTAATQFYKGLNPALKADITRDVYGRYYADLATQLANLKASGQGDGAEAQLLRSTLTSVELSQLQNEISGKWDNISYRTQRENEVRASVYRQVNGVLQSFQGIDPKCIDVMGGWETVLPAVIGVAALATGFTPFAGAAVAGGALALTGNLIVLLQDVHLKSGLNGIVKLQNDQVLACTYYSIKYSACEYKRGFEMSQRTAELKRLIEREFSQVDKPEYDRLFHAQEQLPLMAAVFNQVAEMGTPLTMNLDLLMKYLVALRVSPSTLPPVPGQEDSILKKKNWLVEVSARGIMFNEMDQNGPVPLDRQIEQARTQIEQHEAVILSAESIISEKRSFEDLRHELERREPSLLEEVRETLAFLREMEADQDSRGVPRIPLLKHGPLVVVRDILEKLEAFMAVDVSVSCDPAWGAVDPAGSCYTSALNHFGKELFAAMARGAIAQISQQSVLTLGRKATDRLERALGVIEQQFLLEDLMQHPGADGPFVAYRRDRLAIYNVISNYEQYTPTSTVFRAEKIQQTLRSFERGFQKEMHRMVRRALKSKSELVPGIRGKSAPHLCSLFASSLKKGIWPNPGRTLLHRCRVQHPEIEQISLVANGKVRIQYEDPCFYID